MTHFQYQPRTEWQQQANQERSLCVLFVNEDKTLGTIAKSLDVQMDGALTKALHSPYMKGKAGQSVTVIPSQGVAWSWVVVCGMGDAASRTSMSYEQAAGEAVKRANELGATHLTIMLEEEMIVAECAKGIAEAHMMLGARLGAYYFGKYFTTKKEHELPCVQHVVICGDDGAAQTHHPRLEALAEGMIATRDVVSEPANVLHPQSFAQKCEDMRALGLEVQVLGEDEMRALGMNALLGVGQGSVRASQLVVLRWNGTTKKDSAPIAFVGKGVCFDSGGISIKPAAGMEEMKWDMGGAGAVYGVMRTLALRKACVHAVGILGLVENMPDGNAQRPGDVVVSYSGQTIEVNNTDAEGRLVLADALWYVQEKFRPHTVIDLATLTGAIIVSLGKKYAGLFSNNDELAQRIMGLGDETGDETWRLPMGDYYDKQINSDIADMQNVGTDKEAGSITAAQFLQRFIQKDVAWAHVDIAGTAWRKKATATSPKGATAYGVRLLDALVARYYEV
ncbi:MAG: leucyl aminopeptidase [Alphaproteobacteria bacterium]|nr:MAG: leucyl aminopeptidase [Alphaproteobacteria bacterium]